MINQQHGAAVIAAWQVDSLPLDWLDAFLALDDLPRRKRRQQAIERVFEKARRAHPQYSRYYKGKAKGT